MYFYQLLPSKIAQNEQIAKYMYLNSYAERVWAYRLLPIALKRIGIKSGLTHFNGKLRGRNPDNKAFATFLTRLLRKS